MKTFPIEFLLVNKRSSHSQGVILRCNFSSNRWREIVLFWVKDNNFRLVCHLLNPGLRESAITEHLLRWHCSRPDMEQSQISIRPNQEYTPAPPLTLQSATGVGASGVARELQCQKYQSVQNRLLYSVSLSFPHFLSPSLSPHPSAIHLSSNPAPSLSLFFALSLSLSSHYDPIGSTCLPRRPLPFIPKPSSSVSTLGYVQLLPLFSSLS